MAATMRSLAQLLFATMDDREEDAARISRFLHDNVGQMLSAIGLELEALSLDLAATPDPTVQQRIREIQGQLDQLIQDVRALSSQLNMTPAERVGLAPALVQLREAFRSKIECAIDLQVPPRLRLPAVVSRSWYKIVEWVLTALAEYSRPTYISIRVGSTAEKVVLEIRSDGSLSKPSSRKNAESNMGLLKIEHYAANAGATLSVRNRRPQGCVVRSVYLLPSEP